MNCQIDVCLAPMSHQAMQQGDPRFQPGQSQGAQPQTILGFPTDYLEVVRASLEELKEARILVPPDVEPACRCLTPAAHENDCLWIEWKRNLG